MKLCIAEKPSVAKDLANILGANARHDGYYEGNGYIVSWTFGHLCTLKEPRTIMKTEILEKLKTFPIFPSFGIKIKNNQGIQKQFELIKNLLGKATEVINCGDAGQEGELIQRWVLIKANCTVPVKRLWISSLTEEAIKEGLQRASKTPRNTTTYLLQEIPERLRLGTWNQWNEIIHQKIWKNKNNIICWSGPNPYTCNDCQQTT